MKLKLQYQGWFQCRLATDPDVYDHPRGQDGWTFAFAGEPDLDRLIRFQTTLAPRVEGPDVGVSVVAVTLDGVDQPASPFLNSRVELLGGAVFEGRNGQIAPSAQEPLVPLEIEITSPAGTVLRRADPIDLDDFLSVLRRKPTATRGDDPEVAQATGINDFKAHRTKRLNRLNAILENSQGVARQNLQQRIAQLELGLAEAEDIRFWILGFCLEWNHALRGTTTVANNAGELPALPVTGADWHLKHWMGGWDADALCGYTRGTLTVPLQ